MSQLTKFQIDFIKSYVNCAIWLSSNNNAINNSYSHLNIPDNMLEIMVKDCLDFLSKYEKLFKDADPHYVACGFLMVRNFKLKNGFCNLGLKPFIEKGLVGLASDYYPFSTTFDANNMMAVVKKTKIEKLYYIITVINKNFHNCIQATYILVYSKRFHQYIRWGLYEMGYDGSGKPFPFNKPPSGKKPKLPYWLQIKADDILNEFRTERQTAWKFASNINKKD